MADLYFPKHTGPTKRQKKAAQRRIEGDFRLEVWARDGGRCHATGVLLRVDAEWDDERGEVHHLKGRNVMPEWKTEVDRAVLLSASNHRLADARGGYRLKPTDPVTGEPAVDASKPIRWTLYDTEGNAEWTRIR